MQRSKRFATSLAGVLVAFACIYGTGGTAHAASSGGEVITGVWQHRQANFSYYGITSLYSCDSLESNIRSLLVYLGARKDLKVSANGCPRGSSVPSRNAIIDIDFYVLAASTDSQDVVQAQWMPALVNSTHPYFMGRGDCELIDEMKDLITKNFSLRDLSYRTDCVPHQVNIDDFTIKAQVLKAVPKTGAAKGR
jgi:hypothetical protein